MSARNPGHGHILHRKASGQSLAETAIFLPLLILLLAGVVEVSNLLVTQNRVSTAARVATGFGAANFSAEKWEDSQNWAPAMAQVAFNNVTNTLDLSGPLWDVWTIHAKLNPAGTEFVMWRDVHAHDGDVVGEDQWASMLTQVQNDVLDALRASPEGLEIVATVVFHDRRSLLGLHAFDIGILNRVRGLSVMRVDTPAKLAACNAFPIAISLNNYSLFPTGQSGGNPQPPMEVFPFDTAGNTPYHNQQYHWLGKSGSPPSPPPVYDASDMSQFPGNEPGIILQQAPENGGYIYLSKQSTESGGGGFGWLRWDYRNKFNNAGVLAQSLDYPGNSDTYNQPGFSEDGLGRFDIISVSTGSKNSKDVRQNMRDLTDVQGRTVRLIVFTPPTPPYNGDFNGDGHGTVLGRGSNAVYEVYGFALVKILGWYLPGNQNWMLFELLRLDEDC